MARVSIFSANFYLMPEILKNTILCLHGTITMVRQPSAHLKISNCYLELDKSEGDIWIQEVQSVVCECVFFAESVCVFLVEYMYYSQEVSMCMDSWLGFPLDSL